MATTILSPVAAMPFMLSGRSSESIAGPKIAISDIAELHSRMNHTVPDALTSSLNPYEYLEQQGHNVTGMDILPFMLSKQLNGR